MKFTCGSSSYAHLIKESWPFSSERTLNRKLEFWKFNSRISDEIFNFLRIKSSQFEINVHRDYIIILDEMSIVSGEKFDPSVNEIIGYSTLPNHSCVTMHGLVYL